VMQKQGVSLPLSMATSQEPISSITTEERTNFMRSILNAAKGLIKDKNYSAHTLSASIMQVEAEVLKSSKTKGEYYQQIRQRLKMFQPASLSGVAAVPLSNPISSANGMSTMQASMRGNGATGISGPMTYVTASNAPSGMGRSIAMGPTRTTSTVGVPRTGIPTTIGRNPSMLQSTSVPMTVSSSTQNFSSTNQTQLLPSKTRISNTLHSNTQQPVMKSMSNMTSMMNSTAGVNSRTLGNTTLLNSGGISLQSQPKLTPAPTSSQHVPWSSMSSLPNTASNRQIYMNSLSMNNGTVHKDIYINKLKEVRNKYYKHLLTLSNKIEMKKRYPNSEKMDKTKIATIHQQLKEILTRLNPTVLPSDLPQAIKQLEADEKMVSYWVPSQPYSTSQPIAQQAPKITPNYSATQHQSTYTPVTSNQMYVNNTNRTAEDLRKTASAQHFLQQQILAKNRAALSTMPMQNMASQTTAHSTLIANNNSSTNNQAKPAMTGKTLSTGQTTMSSVTPQASAQPISSTLTPSSVLQPSSSDPSKPTPKQLPPHSSSQLRPSAGYYKKSCQIVTKVKSLDEASLLQVKQCFMQVINQINQGGDVLNPAPTEKRKVAEITYPKSSLWFDQDGEVPFKQESSGTVPSFVGECTFTISPPLKRRKVK